MNDTELKFITDIIKPWDELNKLLSERLVLEPKISDFTRLTNDLAKNIHHQIDYIVKINGENDAKVKETRNIIQNTNNQNKIIGDIADTSKHFDLRDINRIANIELSSTFECSDNKFRFIRNIANIKYKNITQSYDFLEISYQAIKNLITHFTLNINFERLITENSNEFFNEAWLYHDSNKSISIKSTRIEFLRKDEKNNLIHFDPKEVRFAVYPKGI